MDEQEITIVVREVIADTFGVSESDLPDEVSQDNFSRWTSLYHMTLLIALEDRFACSFSLRNQDWS